VGGEGRTSGMASDVCVDKGMCKSQTAKSPRSAKMQAKQKEWVITIVSLCVSGALSLNGVLLCVLNALPSMWLQHY